MYPVTELVLLVVRSLMGKNNATVKMDLKYQEKLGVLVRKCVYHTCMCSNLLCHALMYIYM